MNRPDLRDPNCKLCVICTYVSVAVILAVSVISLAYFIALAPSEAHTLNEGTDPVGYETPIVCGIVYFVCLALLIRDFLRRMKGGPSEERDTRLMRAPLSKAGILMAITALTTFIVIGVAYLVGEAISESFLSKYSTYAVMALMISAGPEEEFLTRALCIGLPVFIVCLIKHQGSAKDILGGFGMSKVALVFLVISSVIFGLLHLEGWSIMKFPDTFISGMLFGYVYIQYGIHASIVMHSAFDLLATYDMFYDGMGTYPLIVLSVLGAILLVRSLLKIREYIPENNLHEPFEGGLIEMWERD